MPALQGFQRRPLLLLGAAAVVSFAFASFPASAQAPAGVLVVGSEGVIPPLDPHRMTGTIGLTIVDALFDTLVREDLTKPTKAAPDLKPALAQSWTISADGKTYSFKIRDGVTFHDGAKIDAQAVLSNFQRLMDKDSPLYDAKAAGNMAFLTSWIATTKAPDAQTFAIELNRPFSGLLRTLSDRRMAIISPKAMEQYKGDELGTRPRGTGAFTLETFVPGKPVDVKRNAKYWGNPPKLQQIVFRPMTDPTAIAIAMQTGEIDLIPSASALQIQQLKSQKGIVVQFPEPANQYYLRLNARVAPTNNVNFRRALNFAVNREGIKTLFDGQAEPVGGPLPRGNEAFGEGVAKRYAYDPKKAKELLQASGLPTPVTLKLMVPTSGPGFGLVQQTISLIQQDFKAVGVNLEPQFMEFSALLANERGGYKDDVAGSYNGWVTGAEMGYWLERMFSGEHHPPKGLNRGWYKNEKADALFAEAQSATDAARQKKIYQHAAEIIADEAPWVFLYQDRLPRIFRDRVSGIVEACSLYYDYTQIAVR